MIPKYWLTEGGQSATGALLDHIIESHVASAHLANEAASRSKTPFQLVIIMFLYVFLDHMLQLHMEYSNCSFIFNF